jgi:hypothetical protein
MGEGKGYASQVDALIASRLGSIFRVSNNGMADGRKLGPNLMIPTGL